jgi:1,4-alpha-glucan branching enzyme
VQKNSTSAAGTFRSKHRHSAGSSNVHFEFVSTVAEDVRLVGTFNGWKPESGTMTRMRNGRWVTDLELAAGIYEYRFVVDGNWIPDPKADHSVMNPYGDRNSVLSVPGRTNHQGVA